MICSGVGNVFSWEESVGIPGKRWWAGRTLLDLGLCLLPFSDLGVLAQTGTAVQQALLCARHWTKTLASCFWSVVHRAIASLPPGSFFNGQHLRLPKQQDLHAHVHVQSEKLCFRVLLLIPHWRPISLEKLSQDAGHKASRGGTALSTQIWPCLQIQPHPSPVESFPLKFPAQILPFT